MASSSATAKSVEATYAFEDSKYNKKIMAQAATVPWIDPWEVRAVGEALLSAAELTFDNPGTEFSPIGAGEHSSCLSLGEALKRVEAWKTRSSQPLPASVESTAALALALWRDTESNKIPASSLPSEHRMMYSTAIIRAINGLADPFQQNRSFATSVAQICSHIGVPLWLVDVRHEATHNQMPSLSVLRMGAVALLKYFRSVYWDPIEKVRKQGEEKIRGCLDDYMDAVERSSKSDNSVKSQSPSLSLRLPVAKEDKDEFFNFEDDSSDTDSDDGVGRPAKTRLGTNVNMFSILTMDSKKKKSKKKGKEQPVDPRVETEDEKTSKKPALRPPDFFVARLFKICVPLEIAWNTTMCHLVLGFGDTLGALVPKSTSDHPCTERSILTIRQRFKSLFSAIGKKWPGLVVALLISIIDRILSIEGTAVIDESRRELYFLESWVRYFLSNAFFVSCGHIRDNARDSGQTPAPLQTLQAFNYPLNGICDRLESSSTPENLQADSTVHRLQLFLSGILRDHRVLERGCIDRSQQPVIPIEIYPSPKATVKGDSSSLSLDEIEALLLEDVPRAVSGSTDGHSNGNSLVDQSTGEMPSHRQQKQNQTSAWVKCEMWESCAIGSLPGYPM